MAKLDGYELILGSSIDAQSARCCCSAPAAARGGVSRTAPSRCRRLNTTLARRLMEQTKIYQVSGRLRGRKPLDVAALERLLVHFSQLVVEQPWMGDRRQPGSWRPPERLLALDARMVLPARERATPILPKLAIRRTRSGTSRHGRCKDGSTVRSGRSARRTSRSVVKFHETLSEERRVLALPETR